MLFQALSSHPDLWSLYRESQPILDGHFTVSMTPGTSALVTADDVDDRTVTGLQREFFDKVGNLEQQKNPLLDRIPLILRNRLSTRLQRFGQADKRPPLRMVEKTPDNCFRLQMLQKVFPDARFVFVLRDPRGSIASVYHGWREESRFRRYALPADFKILEYNGTDWCFGLPPGWEEQSGKRLIEICAWQWASYNEACLRDLPNSEGLVFPVSYEEVSARPGEVLESLAKWADLDPVPLRRFREKLPVVNTWTRPSDEKWRRFETDITSVMDSIAPTSERLAQEFKLRQGGGDS
jgi:hypothetical protein